MLRQVIGLWLSLVKLPDLGIILLIIIIIRRRRPANHPFSQSVDWIAKGAAQRGRTEGAVLPVRRSAPEHDPYMTSEHSTTARWIRLGVNFEEGGNRSTQGKPSKSG